FRLPRAPHDRRARAPPAREARTRPGRAGVHPHRPGRRLPLPRPVNPFRSVGARLAAALAIVVAAALAIVYLALVPALQSRLENAKLNQLERSRRVVLAEYKPLDPDFVTTAAATANARV